jgi:predicted secreted protein
MDKKGRHTAAYVIKWGTFAALPLGWGTHAADTTTGTEIRAPLEPVQIVDFYGQ